MEYSVAQSEVSEVEQRGELLVEELPSILREHGDDFLKITITLGDKVVESNLKEELLLGDAKFDPFAVMDALDKTPATTAFWNTLLVEVKEKLKLAERAFKTTDGSVRMFISGKISAERAGTKAPSAAEIETLYNSLFVPEGQSANVDAAFTGIVKESQDVVKLYQKLQTRMRQLDELKKKAAQLEIIHQAWKDRGYTLASICSLMETLIKQNLVKIPIERKVYENW